MARSTTAIRRGNDEILLQVIGYIVIFIVALACLLPFILVISASFSSEKAIQMNGFSLLPQESTLEAYKQVFSDPSVISRAYAVTITLTVVGTITALFLQSMTAYVISRRDFKWRNIFSFFFYFTTLFNGGLVPYFILMTQYLSLRNNYLALLLPLLFSVFNLLILKGYITGSIPHEIIESAKIDGCGVFRTYISVVLPLMKPVLATIGLFIALGYWNDWYSAMLFITNDDMNPLQYMLYEKVNNIEAYKRLIASGAARGSDVVSALSLPTQTLKMALTVIVTGPIILLYPLIQRFYIRGITLGAVKG